MSMLVRWTPSALTAEQYDEGVGKLEAQGNWPPDGLDYHVCFSANGGFHVSEIWDSKEQLSRAHSTRPGGGIASRDRQALPLAGL